MTVSHIGHVELRVPDVAASTRFLTEFVGLRVTSQDDDVAYLRAWQDFDHHTLKLVRSDTAELGHIGWRAATRDDVLAIEAKVKSLGLESVWVDGSDEAGHGDALRLRSPSGIPLEVYSEVTAFEAPADLRSRFPSHPITLSMGGASTRRLDHVGINVDEPADEQAFFSDVLGVHHRYFGTGPQEERVFSWLSRTSVSHEISMVRNRAEKGPKFHHLAYFIESVEDLLRLATTLIDNGYELDWGPGRHGTSGATALYFKEPGGHRIEIWTGGLLIFAPDWEPFEWKGEILYAVADIWGNCDVNDKFALGTPVAAELAPLARS
ncbi:MAG: VOC family protein [Solirubrobacteraceae bacterium]